MKMTYFFDENLEEILDISKEAAFFLNSSNASFILSI